MEIENSFITYSKEPQSHYQLGMYSFVNVNEENTLFFKGAFRYYSYKSKLLNDYNYSVGTYPSDVTYTYSILKPEIGLKYQLKYKRLIPFIYLGGFTQIFLKDKGTIYNERFDTKTDFFSGGKEENRSGPKNNMLGLSGEIGIETNLKIGSLSLSYFYERFLTIPFTSSYNMGLRCGYYFNRKKESK